MNKHYYILPDGCIVHNMREGKQKLGIGSDAFRSLVRKGIVTKVIYNQKLQSDDPGTPTEEIKL